MIPYNIQPGTKVRNINTGRVRTYKGRVSLNGGAPFAQVTRLRPISWETFSVNYAIENQANPSLMTSIG